MENSQTLVSGGQISSTYLGRVLTLFGLALGVSALGTYIGFNYALVYMMGSPMIMFGIMMLELVVIISAAKWMHLRPLNYFLFAFFAFLSGFTLAPVIYMVLQSGNGEILYRALAATMVTFVAAGLIAWNTNINMMKFQGFLFMSLIGMIVVGLISMFFPFGSMMEGVYSFLGILLFAGYSMYDIQQMKFNTQRNEMEAALALYLDIFNLFLYILRFLGRDH